MPLVQIYVRLLDEGTDVWRPVSATCEGSGTYRIVGENLLPDDERWEFGTGDLVRCEERAFSGTNPGLAAVSKI